MRTLTCKHKIWSGKGGGGGGELVIFEALFKAFPVFSVLETCRLYLLTIDLGIVKCIRKLSSAFLDIAKFVDMDQITCKN